MTGEHRYRMAAKIRPLLLFWVGRDDVGGARIVWRRGPDGTRGWELLIGSDPARAPRRINRWGYLCEEEGPANTTMLGLMKQSDEESIDQAKSSIANESREGYAFRLIRGQSSAGQSTATTRTGRFPRDYTYRDLGAVLSAFDGEGAKTGATKEMKVPAGVKPGFLVAVADLLHDSVAAYRKSGSSGLTRRSVQYAYYGRFYDLVLDRPHVLTNERYGDRTYPKLLEGDFEQTNKATGGKESFSIVYGIDGGIEEVPVFISYQPRWWFKAELVLDSKEKF